MIPLNPDTYPASGPDFVQRCETVRARGGEAARAVAELAIQSHARGTPLSAEQLLQQAEAMAHPRPVSLSPFRVDMRKMLSWKGICLRVSTTVPAGNVCVVGADEYQYHAWAEFQNMRRPASLWPEGVTPYACIPEDVFLDMHRRNLLRLPATVEELLSDIKKARGNPRSASIPPSGVDMKFCVACRRNVSPKLHDDCNMDPTHRRCQGRGRMEREGFTDGK